jgi:superfamily II DNA or RNA helicase
MPENLSFQKGDWIIDQNQPGRPGIFTGRTQRHGHFLLAEIEFGPGDRRFRPTAYLRPAPREQSLTIAERIGESLWGRISDLRRLLTFEKLRGTLDDIIYSMEAAQIDFLPYQFKPVLKFINSPTERLVIADEVGLGKTIEASLIWIEMQARKQARRLLVICPTQLLAKKWRNELREKFLIDARIISFGDLREEINSLQQVGPSHSFALIATYNGLRPPRKEHEHLDEPPEEYEDQSPKTKLCQVFRSWSSDYEPFDLVIFDEAHHMRNAGTANFRLGESLSRYAGAVLCVSATPVNNRNEDLHTLLRLIDDEFFRTQGLFEELLASNRPAVQLANALARIPVDRELLQIALEGLAKSRFVGQSPLFQRLLTRIEKLEFESVSDVAECQDLSEKLNLLGSYVTRTRRVQVKEQRPIRDPLVIQVEYTPPEMRLYQTIIELVRRRSEQDSRPFHIFQVMGLQLRAASSLPVLAEEVRLGKLGDPAELMAESFGAANEDDDFFEEMIDEQWDLSTLDELLNYDFEGHDSKFSKLLELLISTIPDEKVVIFSFYRGTLNYLERRLNHAGITTVQIHGGIDPEDRNDLIEQFHTKPDIRILLSSEVGSEGIDLQHSCRVLLNYDLPWNPMRVEQRIGRIDRVGQKAARLSIVHFKVKNTIEEKLYDRLHGKLAIFANSLGDLEPVIGKIVQDLTVDLLSSRLTPEMEERRIDEAQRVIENRLRDLRLLEESGETLIALSDYLQKRIDEDRGRGRFIQPEELENYMDDFFSRQFRGCQIEWNTPANGCIRVKLTSEAYASLAGFVQDDRSLNALPFRQRDFTITFRREIHQQLLGNRRREIHFVNHLSPLVRWITQLNNESPGAFYNLSAFEIAASGYATGNWLYRIERWIMAGLRKREQLAYAVVHINTGKALDPDSAEKFLQTATKNGKECEGRSFNGGILPEAHSIAELQLQQRFQNAIELFQADNENSYQIRSERARYLFDRRIEQDLQRLESLRRNQRSAQIIRLTEARLQKARDAKERKLAELQSRAAVDVHKSEVAAGIIKVRQP